MRDLSTNEVCRLYEQDYSGIEETSNYRFSESIKYCKVNNLETVPKTKNKMNLPVEELYKLYKDGYTYSKIADKYKVSSVTISNRIKEYCHDNNMNHKFNRKKHKKRALPEAEFYKLYKEGYSYTKIAQEYDVAPETIKNRVRDYCKKNNIKYVPNVNKKELPSAEIYKLYKEGYNLNQIAEKYKVSNVTISNRIKDYCNKNNIEYKYSLKRHSKEKTKLQVERIYKLFEEGYSFNQIIEINKIQSPIYCGENNLVQSSCVNVKRKELPEAELYRLHKLGYTYNQLADRYGVSDTTICNRIKEYCEKNSIECISSTKLIPNIKIELPVAEIYELYKKGYNYAQIAKKYDVSEHTIGNRINTYIRENNILLKKQKYLPIHKVYYQYINGISSEELAKKYDVDEDVLMQEVYKYCTINNIYIVENKLQEIRNKQILLYHLKNVLKNKSSEYKKVKSK